MLEAAAEYYPYLLYDAAATKSCDKLSRRRHSEVSL